MVHSIRHAIEQQSAIIAAVQSAKEPMTVNDIATRLNLDPTKVSGAVATLRKNGKLRRVHVARGRERYAYEVGEEGGRKVPVPAPLPADVKITVVKPTGALRLQYKGLTIELSVEG